MDFSTFRFHLIASRREVADRKRQTTEQLKPSPSADSRKARQLSRDMIEYLHIIQRSPGLPATVRDDEFKISRRKGSVLRKRLTRLGLIESERVLKAGKGRPYDDICLTERGLAILEGLEKIWKQIPFAEKNGFATGEKLSAVTTVKDN